jgi:hypothetical protein
MQDLRQWKKLLESGMLARSPGPAVLPPKPVPSVWTQHEDAMILHLPQARKNRRQRFTVAGTECVKRDERGECNECNE